MYAVIAFPTTAKGGSDGPISDHFGQAESFTIVALDGDNAAVEVIDNPGHAEGGCGGLVKVLAERGVRIVVARGMGPGPLRLFAMSGIMVLHAGVSATVGEALDSLQNGRLAQFSAEHSCNHHGHDHGHGDGHGHHH